VPKSGAFVTSKASIFGGHWFAFAGPPEVDGWPAPEAMLKVLEEKKFDGCGAAVGDKIAFVICEAALRAIQKRKNDQPVTTETQTHTDISPDSRH